MLLSEERSPTWFRPHDEVKLGVIVTYFPLSRLARFHLTGHGSFSTLGLEAHAHHGGERLEILFASAQAGAVLRLMNGIGRGLGMDALGASV